MTIWRYQTMLMYRKRTSGRDSKADSSLVDLFSTTDPRISSLKSLLATYYRLLVSSRLSNAALADVPLPKTLDPKTKISMPSRFYPLWLLFKDTLISLIRLPFFIIPMIAHIPIYIIGILGSRLAESEMETQAQMKVAAGIVLSFLTYPLLFFTFYVFFRQLPLGAALSAGAVWVLGRYHTALVDENYTA